MPPPRTHLASSIFFLLLLSAQASSSSSDDDFSLSLSSLSPSNLTLLGDAHLLDGLISLTSNLQVPSSSSGTATFNRPISLSSFSSKFTFSIPNPSPSSPGHGLTFFLSPHPSTLGSPGPFLALVNASDLAQNRFLALEFDTHLDPLFRDPSDHHLGLDLDSLDSIRTVDPAGDGVFLKSGNKITAWVEYKGDLGRFFVFLSYSCFRKPPRPLLVVDVDLGEYFKRPMFVGFSGSTEGSTEIHVVESWTFHGSGSRGRFRPRNVSDSSLVQNPFPISGSGSEPEPEGFAKKKKTRLGLGFGIGGPAVLICVGFVVFGYVAVRRWSGAREERDGFKAELLAGPREFRYRELRLATRGFHSSRILGHGAFGTVYKALFDSKIGGGGGAVAAVKRSKHSHEGKAEFLAELSTIACLRHKNLVQLQGWCVEKGELLLVYDFMPNGSLDKVLYQDSCQGPLLHWSHRYNIAVGMASVLAYLHEECEQQVIHRDIKTSNIMLDRNFNARLGDFGLARLMDHDQSPVSTLTGGTMGYLAPEYLQYGKATEKTDAFSYGVVVLEVSCGRRPIERETNSQRMVNLVDWVWRLYSQGKIMEAADPRLNGEFQEDEMRKMLLVGLSCANPDSNERPSMRRVLQILNKEAELTVVPMVKPSLTFSQGLPLSLEDIVSESEV